MVALVAIAAAFAFYFSNIQTVPVSGRRRFNCFSKNFVEAVAEQQVRRVIWEVEHQGGRFLPAWDPRVRMVGRVMERLIPVSGMEDAQWEIRVIDDRTANAFVLPGGKVFVHSGLLSVARNEDGLAAVLGHEIAHNLADHVGERMSGSIGTDVLLGAAILLTGGLAAIATWALGNRVLDVLFGRPMGRRQESEADYIGLMMMAEACYDPRVALDFWRRMERMQQLEPPEWLSTHPSVCPTVLLSTAPVPCDFRIAFVYTHILPKLDDIDANLSRPQNHNRIQKIAEWMPQALEKRQLSDCHGTTAFADAFRKALDQGYIITTSGWA